MATSRAAARLAPFMSMRCTLTSVRSAFAPALRPSGLPVTLSLPRNASPSMASPCMRYATKASVLPLEAPPQSSPKEAEIFNKLRDAFNPTKLFVEDISGGCGSMYALTVVAEQFRGLPVIKQHRMVNSALAEEIKEWHGVQLKTLAPEGDPPSK